MLRVVGDGRRNRSFVGFHRKRARLELIGFVVRWWMCAVLRFRVHDWQRMAAGDSPL
jgi:hypothetical protein